MNIEKLRTDFVRDGFVLVPKFLTGKELSELERESNEAIRKNQMPVTGKGIKCMDRFHPWFY